MPTWFLSPIATQSPTLETFKEPRNRFPESIPPTYLAWRADTSKRAVVPARQAGNLFIGSFKDLQVVALYVYLTDERGPGDECKVVATATTPASVWDSCSTHLFLFLTLSSTVFLSKFSISLANDDFALVLTQFFHGNTTIVLPFQTYSKEKTELRGVRC
jgi:hypothetical protein